MTKEIPMTKSEARVCESSRSAGLQRAAELHSAEIVTNPSAQILNRIRKSVPNCRVQLGSTFCNRRNVNFSARIFVIGPSSFFRHSALVIRHFPPDYV
jgi:hypothetical protein